MKREVERSTLKIKKIQKVINQKTLFPLYLFETELSTNYPLQIENNALNKIGPLNCP